MMDDGKRYQVNEVFYSLQGEGVRAGTPNVFVRFSGCNLTCKQETHGFDCDTEFMAGRKMRANEIMDLAASFVRNAAPEAFARPDAMRLATEQAVGVIFTGGEPALQLDTLLVASFKAAGWHTAIETNGSIAIPDNVLMHLDWITVSPKVAEHAIRQTMADEVKYVRHNGQPIPRTSVRDRAGGRVLHKLISPAANTVGIPRANLDWCIRLCHENPPWRLSVQQHKMWVVR